MFGLDWGLAFSQRALWLCLGFQRSPNAGGEKKGVRASERCGCAPRPGLEAVPVHPASATQIAIGPLPRRVCHC